MLTMLLPIKMVVRVLSNRSQTQRALFARLFPLSARVRKRTRLAAVYAVSELEKYAESRRKMKHNDKGTILAGSKGIPTPFNILSMVSYHRCVEYASILLILQAKCQMYKKLVK